MAHDAMPTVVLTLVGGGPMTLKYTLFDVRVLNLANERGADKFTLNYKTAQGGAGLRCSAALIGLCGTTWPARQSGWMRPTLS